MGQGYLQIKSILTPIDEKNGNTVTVAVDTKNIGTTIFDDADYFFAKILMNDVTIWEGCYPADGTCNQQLVENGSWLFQKTFLMPTKDAIIDVYTYNWNGTTWTQNDHRSSTVVWDGYLDVFSFEVSPNPANNGDTVTATIVTENTGGADYFKLVVERDGSVIYDKCYPADGTCNKKLSTLTRWNVYPTFIMGSSSTTITIKPYHWDEDLSLWVRDGPTIPKEITVSPGIPSCSSASIQFSGPYERNVNDVITFTLSRSPAFAGLTATLMEQLSSGDVSRGTCSTSINGDCTVDWTASVGQHAFYAKFSDCTSTTKAVNIGIPGNVVVQSVLINPNSVLQNTNFNVEVSVTNPGYFSGSKFVYIKRDNVDFDSRFVTLAAGETRTEYFQYNASGSWTINSHNICAETTGDTKCKTFDIVSTALCVGIACKPVCSGGTLYEGKCDPATGSCIADTTKSILAPCPTNFIEYDISFLPQEILDFVAGDITYISNIIGPYLPLPSNVVYRMTTYNDGKFRVYVNFTAVMNTMHTYDVTTMYDTTVLPLITVTDLVGVARALAGIVVFVLVGQYVTRLGIQNIVIAAIIAGVASVAINFAIFDVLLAKTTTGAIPKPTAAQDLNSINAFVDNEGTKAPAILWPACATDPPTCDVATMKLYIAGISSIRFAQCIKANSFLKNPESICNPKKDAILLIIKELDNGTITPTQAKQRLQTDVVLPIQQDAGNILQQISCPGQTWDVNLQKCVDIEKACWVKNPVGGCILSASTGTILVVGGLAIAGIIIYKNVIKK